MRYNVTTNQWSLQGGRTDVDLAGVFPSASGISAYGIEGPDYYPGARDSCQLAIDPTTNYVYLWGGSGKSRVADIHVFNYAIDARHVGWLVAIINRLWCNCW